jgi:hypothetical protein
VRVRLEAEPGRLAGTLSTGPAPDEGGRNGVVAVAPRVHTPLMDQVDFAGSRLHVRRNKKGTPATHPLQGDTMRALRRLRKEAPHAEFVFVSERGSPFSASGFAKLQVSFAERTGLPSCADSARVRTTSAAQGCRMGAL